MDSKAQLRISLRVKDRIGDLQYAASLTNTPRSVIEEAIDRDGYFLSEKYRVELMPKVTFWNSSDHPDAKGT